MYYQEVKQAVLAVVKQGKTSLIPHLVSPPGIGKSALVYEVGAELGLPVLEVRGTDKETVDFRGCPDLSGEETVWKRPNFLPKDGAGIFFIDEFAASDESILKLLSQLLLTYRVGEHELGRGWHFVCASNGLEDRAGANRLPTHVQNRVVELRLEPSFEQWRDWAIGKGIHPDIIAHLNTDPSHLHEWEVAEGGNRKGAIVGRPFASPRSYERASEIIGLGVPPAVEFSMFCGAIGEAEAVRLRKHRELLSKMPDPDAIIADPEGAEIPGEPSILYAVALALAYRADKKRFGNIVKFADRLSAEIGVLIVRDSIRRTSALKETEVLAEWATKHSNVLF